MSFCLEGRYENSWNDRYSFILSAGDFSVGFAGRKEGGGRFPLRSYKGILLILDAEAFSEFHSNILRELEINLDGIVSLASRQPHYFKLRSNEELNVILNSIVSGFAGRNIPLLRIKVLELLLFLSSPDTTDLKELPAYLNKKNVALAKAVYAALTQDLSRHLTLEQLAAEFDSGITSLKKSFKSVYGISVYQYLKDLRLQEAQRQLRETDLSVSSIAFSVGYANSSKFSSSFKAKFGISPTMYREQTRHFRD